MRDELNIITSMVVPAASLEDKEGYCVGPDGALTAAAGDGVYGVVRIGRPALEATQVVVAGECTARVDGSSTALAAGDLITGGPNGYFVKAVAGTTMPRGMVLEAVSTATTARVLLY